MATDRDSVVLLSRVLAALGVTLVLPACSPRQVGESDDEAADDESSGSESGSETESSSSSADETSESSSGSTSESSEDADDASETSEGDDPIEILDVLTTTTTDGDACMGQPPLWFEIDAEIPPRCRDPREPGSAFTLCFELPEDTTCENPPFTEACLSESLELACIDSVTCGPTTIDGACCFVVIGGCVPGRGFLVAGEPGSAIMAKRTSDPSWTQLEQPELDGLDPDTRATLADVWASDAQAEHASVASFARFTAQLLALGAPPELVAASVRASADEVRHAKRCFGLASAYAGEPIGPGALELRRCLPGQRVELDAAARELAIEGCIVETVSTLLLAAARDRARDAAVRAVLSELVRDEEDHVVLAWQALAWMVGRAGPQLRRSLAATFERAESWVRSEPIERAGDPERLRAHGYLSTRERRAIALDVIDRLVLPAARSLLAAPELWITDPTCDLDP